MAEKTYLADKVTQNEIKQDTSSIKQDTSQISSKASQTSVDNVRNDTQFIRNQFPISSPPSTTYSTITVDTEGDLLGSLTGRGVLYKLRVTPDINNDREYHIEIDGRPIENWFEAGPFNREYNLPFSSSVKVYSQDSFATVQFVYGR